MKNTKDDFIRYGSINFVIFFFFINQFPYLIFFIEMKLDLLKIK
jgi:hypothetical protein